jgi:hypothetical protein
MRWKLVLIVAVVVFMGINIALWYNRIPKGEVEKQIPIQVDEHKGVAENEKSNATEVQSKTGDASFMLAEQFQGMMGQVNLEQVLGDWFSSMAIHMKPQSTIADQVVEEFYEEWRGKLFSLKGFYGNAEAKKAFASEIEMVLFEQFQADAKSLKLFDFKTKEDRSRVRDEFVRYQETTEFIQKHAGVIKALDNWMQKKLSAIPADLKQKSIRGYRSSVLMDFVEIAVLDKRHITATDPNYGKFRSANFKVYKIFQENGFAENPTSKYGKPVSMLEKRFVEYFHAVIAQPNHPLFSNLEEEGNYNELLNAYKKHLKTGATAEELQALEAINDLYLQPDIPVSHSETPKKLDGKSDR